MVRNEHSVVINRPIDEVFAYVDDPDTAPQWQGSVLESRQTSEGPVGVGTTGEVVVQFLGRRFESTWEVTEHQPNEKSVLRSTSGPVPFKQFATLESVEGGTKIDFVFEAEPGGFFKLAEPLLAPIGQRQIETDAATLKALLEAQAEGSA
ncbi:MAG: SRPBCC family protein [Anaerolineae bacterium]